jgi:hypothetical protein
MMFSEHKLLKEKILKVGNKGYFIVFKEQEDGKYNCKTTPEFLDLMNQSQENDINDTQK